MATYKLIITDVTRYGDLFCVAGWDVEDGGMVRPEPHDAVANREASRFWKGDLAGPNRALAAGNLVQLEAKLPPRDFPYPHASEDRLVVASTEVAKLQELDAKGVAKLAEGSVHKSLGEVFGGRLIRSNSGKAYVSAGERVASLGAIEVSPTSVRFYEQRNSQTGKRQLRALIREQGVDYDLSVPADSPRGLFLSDGADAVQAYARECNTLHLRIGLCRPFAAMPDSCYAQVNGLYRL